MLPVAKNSIWTSCSLEDRSDWSIESCVTSWCECIFLLFLFGSWIFWSSQTLAFLITMSPFKATVWLRIIRKFCESSFINMKTHFTQITHEWDKLRCYLEREVTQLHWWFMTKWNFCFNCLEISAFLFHFDHFFHFTILTYFTINFLSNLENNTHHQLWSTESEPFLIDIYVWMP